MVEREMAQGRPLLWRLTCWDWFVPLPSGCNECETLFGRAFRAIHNHLVALERVERAVLEGRDDMSDLEEALRDASQARRDAVENYQLHCAMHVAKYRVAGGSDEPYELQDHPV
jgi:hypothetical protein